jgi:hypothetical protein
MDVEAYVELLTQGREYRVAFVRADGEFDVVERFMALDDEAANERAEQQYGEAEWFLLDRDNININGGPQ